MNRIIYLAVTLVLLISGSAVFADFEVLRKKYEKEIQYGPFGKEIVDIVWEMGELDDPAVIPFLREVSQMKLYSGLTMDIEILENGEEVMIEVPSVHTAPGLAEIVLARLGDEEVLERILERSHDEQLRVRANSIEKLAMIGGDRVVVPLLNLLEDRSPASLDFIVSYKILNTLGQVVEFPPLNFSDYGKDPLPSETDKAIALWREWQAKYYPESVVDNIKAVMNSEGEWVSIYPNRENESDRSVEERANSLSIGTVQQHESSSAKYSVSEPKEKDVTSMRLYLIIGLILGVVVFGFYFSKRKK